MLQSESVLSVVFRDVIMLTISVVDLPEYTTYEKLRTQLLLAINEGGEGFGYVAVTFHVFSAH